MLSSNAPYFSELDSPIGRLVLVGDEHALSALHMHAPVALPSGCTRSDRAFRHVREQLRAYFAGTLQHFEVELAASGSAFQRRVWSELVKIPYAHTESYGAVARRVGQPTASRAVGLANGRNPIGIIVPCHRVIGKNGSLTGYGGGLPRKKWLLEHERRHALHARASRVAPGASLSESR
jgi:methylated-DNA-[protein]-cysteine S-methyltransferase